MSGHDGANLESRITSLKEQMASVADDTGSSLDELWRIIHFPGWTTLPEAILVQGVIDSMEAQLKVFAGLRQVLMEGSRAIVEKGAE